MSTAILGNGVKRGETGEHFTDTQNKDKRFRNISSIWTSQCMTFDEGIAELENQQSTIVDHHDTLNDWEPVVNEKGQFALLHKPEGRSYVPTPHCLDMIAGVGETSRWMLSDLTADKENKNKKGGDYKYTRDFTDAELIVRIVKHTLFHPTRIKQDTPRLFRTWKDGTLRALLSSRYAIVNNLWYLHVLRDLIPGGLLSHWRGDADTIFGNVLIPDTIRQESDSEYGGMLSVGNSEIGLRRIMSLPSVFRAICMNGCIWEQEKGSKISQVHKGVIDLEQLKQSIKKNLEKQIPLLGDGIKQHLGLRGRGLGDVTPLQGLAELARTFKLSKKEAIAVREAYDVEADSLGDVAKTAFGLTQAVTRAGQKLSAQKWFDFDRIGGDMQTMTDDKWNNFRSRAGKLDTSEVEKLTGLVV